MTSYIKYIRLRIVLKYRLNHLNLQYIFCGHTECLIGYCPSNRVIKYFDMRYYTLTILLKLLEIVLTETPVRRYYTRILAIDRRHLLQSNLDKRFSRKG